MRVKLLSRSHFRASDDAVSSVEVIEHL